MAKFEFRLMVGDLKIVEKEIVEIDDDELNEFETEDEKINYIESYLKEWKDAVIFYDFIDIE